jgi:SAM-dependent methyltransferase
VSDADQAWAIRETNFPEKGPTRTEVDLGLPRKKPRSVVISLGYRLFRLSRRLLGDQRMLGLFLDSAWLLRKFAYEASYERYGAAFLNNTHGLSSTLLERWIPPGSSVVDIGCGYGRLCRLVAPYAGRVVGIDRDARRIELARGVRSAGNIEYRVSDVTRELGGEKFDVALLVHVLEHVDDVDDFLRTIARLASALIIEVPDFESDCLNLVRRDIGRPWYTDADHVREYTREVLSDQLTRNGWVSQAWNHRGGMLAALAVRDAAHAG